MHCRYVAAFLQINRIDHKLDGKILRVKVQPSGAGVKYIATVDGAQRELLCVDDKSAELNVTGMPWRSALRYDKKLSDEGDAQHFLTAYMDQQGLTP